MIKAKLSSLTFFDNLLEPLFAFNVSGEIIYCNNTSSSFLEISERRILKLKDFNKLVKSNEIIEELNHLTTITDVTPYKEFNFETFEGNQCKVVYTFQPIELNSEPVWLMYMRDMTLELRLQTKYQKESQEKETYIRQLELAQIELNNYSKNLKKLVDERTFELKSLNSLMAALLDSLDPAFFMFDRDGICLPVYSKSCEKLIECKPVGKRIWDVLKLPSDHHESIKKWIYTLFENMLPFDDLKVLGPDKFESEHDLHIELKYFPLIDEQTDKLNAVVVMATDMTEINIAKESAEKERNYAMMMVNILKRRKEMTQFVFDAQKIIDELRRVLSDQFGFNLQVVFRLLHTLKGGAASFAIQELTNAAHDAEQVLLTINDEGLSKQTLEKMNEHFSNIRYQFQTFLKSNEVFLGSSIVHGIRTIEVPVPTLNNFLKKLNRYQDVKEQISKFEHDIFYVPVSHFLDGYNDTALSLAHRLGKKLKPLKIIGGNTLVHREIYSELFSTLIHQFNNAIDHGIEEPDLRKFNHKNEEGEICVEVKIEKKNESEYLIIKVSDDGSGIDPNKIRQILRKKNLDIKNNNFADESDEDILQHIFDSQFSTKDEATIVSGRGIGMNAILFAAYNLGGTAFVKSEIQKGTELWIRVPYKKESFKLNSVAS